MVVTFELEEVPIRFDEIMAHVSRGDDVRIHRNGGFEETFQLYLRKQQPVVPPSADDYTLGGYQYLEEDDLPPEMATGTDPKDYIPSNASRVFILDMHPGAMEMSADFDAPLTEEFPEDLQ